MSRRILVIDDDADTLDCLKMAFRIHGYLAVGCGDGESGLALAQQERPDLVIVDVMLPGMDGYDVCRRLRADPETARIPIIILTARYRLLDQTHGLEIGADQFVSKPVSLERLLKVADDLMAARAGPH